MKALFVELAGNEPVLAVKQVPDPAPGPDDVIIEVAACGMCHHDVAVMSGLLRRGVRHDGILGHEISGRVVELGSEVSQAKVGDSVVSALTTFCGKCTRCQSGNQYRCEYAQGVGHAIDGGFAQFVKLPQNAIIHIPDTIDMESAALLACPIGVSLRALQDVAKLRAGETALITGAGGGLGVHSVQIAQELGARVLAVTSSPEKVEQLEQLASVEVILNDGLDFSEIALALTEDAGADVVINTVGSVVFRPAIRSLAQYGRMVLLGEVTGERVSLNLTEILFRDASVMGSTGASPSHIQEAAEMVASKKIKLIISAKYSLEEATEAFRAIRNKKTFGRALLIPIV